ncbi:hypothetical protein HAX54_042391 [Datura stramonium]|uniref:Uncharacterized protein n=1 Tax=Datura stramonium TaxID=4076 RepID=A0ABS8W0Q1_DATST|nr:hypothetical protein [Datura stramonium]
MIQLRNKTTSLRTGHCKVAWPVVSGYCFHPECPFSEPNQRALKMDRSKIKRVMSSVVIKQCANWFYFFVNLTICLTSTMTSPVNKKKQEVFAQKEIAKRRQHHDESELESSSGLEVHYNIETSDESPVVTNRAKSKSQEVVAATTSPPQFDKGSDDAEPNGENPPADNAEEGNYDAEESGDDDTNVEESGDKDRTAEESNEQVGDSEPATTLEESSKRWLQQSSRDVYFAGLNINEKGNPSRSIQEEPKIQNNALNDVPELKRIFKGYNMYWMSKTPGKYSMEMVYEFYTNYYYTLEKKSYSKKAIKKEPMLDSIRVRAIPVDISDRTITRVLMGGDFTLPTRTTEYDY